MSCTDLIRTSICELMISHLSLHRLHNTSIVIERLLSAWLTSFIVRPQPEQNGMIAKTGVGSSFLIQYLCLSFVSSDNLTVTQPPPGVLNLLLIVSGDG